MISLLSSHCPQNCCSVQCPNFFQTCCCWGTTECTMHVVSPIYLHCLQWDCNAVWVFLEFYSNLKILNFKVNVFSNYRKLQHVLLKAICSKASSKLLKEGGCGSANDYWGDAVTVHRKLRSKSNESSGHQFLATDFKAVVIFKVIYLYSRGPGYYIPNVLDHLSNLLSH